MTSPAQTSATSTNRQASRSNATIAALAAEAARLDQRSQTATGRTVAILTVGASVLGFAATRVETITGDSAQAIAYFGIPVVFAVILQLCVYQAAESIYLGYHLRAIGTVLGQLTGRPAEFAGEFGFAHNVLSLRSGVLGVRATNFGFAIAGSMAALLLVGFCLKRLAELAPWEITALASTVFALFSLAIVLGMFGAFYHGRTAYDRTLEDVRAGRHLGGGSVPDDLKDPTSVLLLGSYIILPRVGDLLAKSLSFVLGLGFAVVWEITMATDSASVDWSAVKRFAVIAGVTWFALEFLLNQSKYMWNDLRDRDNDSQTAGKQRNRPLARWSHSRLVLHTVAAASMLRVAAGALVLASLSRADESLRLLFAPAVALIALQIGYEAWWKTGTWTRVVALAPVYGIRAGAAAFVGALALDLKFDDRLWFGVAAIALLSGMLATLNQVSWVRCQAHFEKQAAPARDLEAIREGLGSFFTATAERWHRAMIPIVVVAATLPSLTLPGNNPRVGYLLLISLVFGGLGVLSTRTDYSRRHSFRVSGGSAPLNSSPRLLWLQVSWGFVAACGVAATLYRPEQAALIWATVLPMVAFGIGVWSYHASYEQQAFEVRPERIVALLIRAYRCMFKL